MPDAVEARKTAEASLPQMAEETICVERLDILVQRGEIALGEAMSQHHCAGAFGPISESGPVRIFRLRDVVLAADSLMLSKGGEPIAETAYFVEHLSNGMRGWNGSIRWVPAAEAVIVGCNLVYRRYQHWMTQCLPAIDWSLRHRRRDNVRLALPQLEQWQEETLDLAGYASTPRLTIKPGERYFLSHAEYSDFLNGTTSFQACRSLLATARRLANAVVPVRSPHRVIYVPCTDAYYGRMQNEEELVAVLQKHGTHVVSTTDTTVSERINLFRQADIVIGAHGEGLTDVLFCRPGSVMWELMPRHHQNLCYHRIAQTACLDYWGDLFGSDQDVRPPQDWQVDLDVVADRLKMISQRLSLPAGHPYMVRLPEPKPLDQLMMEFENLGDNCEFGLVQRHGKAEPLGLLRFASFFVPIELRLERLVAALDQQFEGLGATGTVSITAEGVNREFMVKEAAYGLLYHTFRHETEIDGNAVRESEPKRLSFLRRKLLSDLSSSEKIWVWKSAATQTIGQLAPLLEALLRHGPNILLWVAEADERHPSGTVERLQDHLLKGYVARFAPAGNATDIDHGPWFEMCARAYDLGRSIVLPEAKASSPLAPAPSALDYLARRAATPVAKERGDSAIARLLGWVRRMLRRD